jgi:TIM-barrel protein
MPAPASASEPAFDPPVAAASLSGESDAAWAEAAAPSVGCAFLGGIALDGPTRAAARELRSRDRTEFLPSDPIGFVDEQLAALALSDVDVRPGVNVRGVSPEPIEAVASVCADRGAIVEINAHCRQEEMCDVGAGETLLSDGDRLCEYVAAASGTDATVSVKLRTEVPGVDLPALSARLSAAGADLLHVDAMDSEPTIAEVVDAAPDAAVIANNGVRDRATVREYLEYGADAVSVGRPSDDPELLERVRSAAEEWFDESARRTEPPADA